MSEFEQTLKTPIGELQVCANEQGVTAILFTPNEDYRPKPNAHTKEACQQLDEYFKGERKIFSLSLNAQGTEFQHGVWQQLQAIPFGRSCSYSDVAQEIGKPKAVRAVGAANGRNPIPIVVPCHRVIGSNGKLTGFAGGLETKAWLLQHEGLGLL